MAYLTRVWERTKPRLLVLTLHTGRVRICWFLPLWVVEECLLFTVKVAPVVVSIALRRRKDEPLALTSALLPLVQTLLDDAGRGVLTLPRGEVFVSLETHDVFIEVRQI